jgi:hypothetical protein
MDDNSKGIIPLARTLARFQNEGDQCFRNLENDKVICCISCLSPCSLGTTDTPSLIAIDARFDWCILVSMGRPLATVVVDISVRHS